MGREGWKNGMKNVRKEWMGGEQEKTRPVLGNSHMNVKDGDRTRIK